MTTSPRVLDRDRMAAALETARAAGKRIVFTNGAFDLLHVGHVRMLEAARACGDLLVVGVNADASVARQKGPGRPRVPASERAEIVAALAPVDYVTIFDEDTVDALLEQLRPDVHAKGRDYTESTLPERRTNERLGIDMVFVGDAKSRASSALAPSGAERPDRVESLDLSGGCGVLTFEARRHFARHGFADPHRWVDPDLGELVEGTSKRWVRRVLVGGVPLFVKVTRPGERKRSPLAEWENHIALRAAGFGAPSPWLAVEGELQGAFTGVLVTREAPGRRLDHVLRDELPLAAPRSRHALARGIGSAIRALHASRFLHPDLQAWHLHVAGSPAQGVRAFWFLDLMRVTRAGRDVRRKEAAVGLAALALSLRPVTDARFRLAILRAYLGGSLAEAGPWLRAIERRIERIRDRSTFRHLGAAPEPAP